PSATVPTRRCRARIVAGPIRPSAATPRRRCSAWIAGDALVFAGATHCQPLVRPGLLARHCWFCPQISPSATVPRTCCKRRVVDLPQYPSAVSFAAFFDLLGFDGFGFDTGFDGFETAPEAFLASFKMP